MKHTFLFLIILFYSIRTLSQCNVNSIRVSTAYNAYSNSVIPPSTSASVYDPNWVVTVDNELSTSEPRPANIIPNLSFITIPTSGWISIVPSIYYGPNNPPPSPAIVLEYKFCINSGISLSDINATFKLAADDGAQLFLNNHYLGVTPNTPYAHYATINVSSGSAYFQTGSNVLQIRLINTGSSIMGAGLDGVISGPSGAFNKPQCCNQNIFVTGQKFADINGNGIKDSNENGIPGWTIYYKNASGTVVATAVTDIYGNYCFSNIPTNPPTSNNTTLVTLGSFTIEENLPPSGFYQTFPLTPGKWYNNTDQYGIVSGRNFGNAPCPPSVSIVASPSPFCLNEPVTFSIVGPPSIMLSNYNFTWNFGDGTTASGSTQTHIYTTGGSKNVTLSGGPVTPVECAINNTNITINQSENCCPECLPSFQPIPNRKYVLSAWVSEHTLGKESFIDPEIYLKFTTNTGVLTYGPYTGKGNIIDGWQRVEQEFTVPYNATDITVQLSSRSGTGSGQVYFDDVRIHPFDAGFKSYVYDPVTLKFTAELDNNNYATFYEYDEEGKLVRVKKETERKTVTIKESRNSTIKR